MSIFQVDSLFYFLIGFVTFIGSGIVIYLSLIHILIVRDKELSKMNDEQLTIFRRRNIGFIFQNYNRVPILNVYENIVLPVELDGDTVDQKFLDEIVHLLGLEDIGISLFDIMPEQEITVEACKII